MLHDDIIIRAAIYVHLQHTSVCHVPWKWEYQVAFMYAGAEYAVCAYLFPVCYIPAMMPDLSAV